MIVHILEKSEWEQAKEAGFYEARNIKKDGFIHCSLTEQIVGVANFGYVGRQNMLMLVLDEEKVDSPVVFEDLYGYEVDFPHIYGPINLDSVVEVLEFPCNEDGTFDLPKEAEKYLA